MLVATICVPYVFLFLEALAKSLFRNRRGPVLTDLITVTNETNQFQRIRSTTTLDFSSREYSHVRCLSTRVSCST
jgi:hypothetical protein